MAGFTRKTTENHNVEEVHLEVESVCVCVCVCLKEREREREREGKGDIINFTTTFELKAH